MKNTDKYIYEKNIKFPNCVANIYQPIITEEERNRRMEVLKKAAGSLLLTAERAKHKK